MVHQSTLTLLTVDRVGTNYWVTRVSVTNWLINSFRVDTYSCQSTKQSLFYNSEVIHIDKTDYGYMCILACLLKAWWNISSTSVSIRMRFSSIFSAAKIWRCLHSVLPDFNSSKQRRRALPVCVRWDKRRPRLKWRVNRAGNCRSRTRPCVFEIPAKIKQERPEVSQRKHCLYRTRGLLAFALRTTNQSRFIVRFDKGAESTISYCCSRGTLGFVSVTVCLLQAATTRGTTMRKRTESCCGHICD